MDYRQFISGCVRYIIVFDDAEFSAFVQNIQPFPDIGYFDFYV